MAKSPNPSIKSGRPKASFWLPSLALGAPYFKRWLHKMTISSTRFKHLKDWIRTPR